MHRGVDASKRPQTDVWSSKGVETDEELIERLSGGHDDAAEALFARYGAAVFALALRILQRREEAEEVLQDTFLKLYREAPRYRAARGSVKTFIYILARNEALSSLRTRKRHSGRTLYYDAHDLGAWLPAPQASDPLTSVMIRSALEQLSAQERELLEASFYEGVSHELLARRFELPLGTLKSKLRRALLKLHDLLADE